MEMDRVRVQKVPRKLELETAPKSSRGTKRVGMNTEVGVLKAESNRNESEDGVDLQPSVGLGGIRSKAFGMPRKTSARCSSTPLTSTSDGIVPVSW